MDHFKLMLYQIPGGQFTVSHIHPITNEKFRTLFDSKTEAERHRTKIEEGIVARQHKSYQELSVEDWLLLFLGQRERKTWDSWITHCQDFLKTFGKLPIEDVTEDKLKLWLDQIQKEHGYAEISMRGIKFQFNTFFTFLVEKEIISVSPLKYIFYKNFTPPISSRNILSADDIKALLKRIERFSPGYLYPLVRMFVETGAKTGEVLELTWDEVNLKDHKVHFKQTESSRERTLPLSGALVEMLAKKQRTSGPIFMTYYGEPFTSKKVSLAVNEFRAKDKGDLKWTPMDLRHSYAVNFLKAGGDIKRLQYILGHWNVYDTRKLYGQDDHPRKCASGHGKGLGELLARDIDKNSA